MPVSVPARARARALVSVVVAVLALGACSEDSGSVTDVATESTTSLVTSTSTTPSAIATAPTANPSTTAAAGASTTSTTRGTTQTKRYTKSANGKTVTLEPGDKLEVSLEQCGGCGYEWRQTRAPDAKVLEATGSESVPRPRPEGMVGTPSDQIFRYEAVGAGTTRFVLGYFGPAKDEPDERFTLYVKVV